MGKILLENQPTYEVYPPLKGQQLTELNLLVQERLAITCRPSTGVSGSLGIFDQAQSLG